MYHQHTKRAQGEARREARERIVREFKHRKPVRHRGLAEDLEIFCQCCPEDETLNPTPEILNPKP